MPKRATNKPAPAAELILCHRLSEVGVTLWQIAAVFEISVSTAMNRRNAGRKLTAAGSPDIDGVDRKRRFRHRRGAKPRFGKSYSTEFVDAIWELAEWWDARNPYAGDAELARRLGMSAQTFAQLLAHRRRQLDAAATGGFDIVKVRLVDFRRADYARPLKCQVFAGGERCALPADWHARLQFRACTPCLQAALDGGSDAVALVME